MAPPPLDTASGGFVLDAPPPPDTAPVPPAAPAPASGGFVLDTPAPSDTAPAAPAAPAATPASSGGFVLDTAPAPASAPTSLPDTLAPSVAPATLPDVFTPGMGAVPPEQAPPPAPEGFFQSLLSGGRAAIQEGNQLTAGTTFQDQPPPAPRTWAGDVGYGLAHSAPTLGGMALGGAAGAGVGGLFGGV